MTAGKAVDILGRLAREAAPIAEVWHDTLPAALKALCPAPAIPPADVILPPDKPASLAWHVDRLSELARAAPNAVTAARVRYHARMLGYALAPARAEFRPLVTILLPVFDRAGPLIEAVQSSNWEETRDRMKTLEGLFDSTRIFRKPV